MCFPYIYLLSLVICFVTFTTSSEASFFSSRATKKRIQERVQSGGTLPPGLDGRCHPTCTETICTSKIPTLYLWEAIAWCKQNCDNSRTAAQYTQSQDYPTNVCKGRLPPFDPNQERWERERGQYMDPNMRRDLALENRKNLTGTTGVLSRTGQAVKRVWKGGLDKFSCNFCQNAKKVCPSNSNSNYQENAELCVQHCWTAQWLRDNTTFRPDLQEKEKENLQENMRIYITGLCAGLHSVTEELQQNLSKPGVNKYEDYTTHSTVNDPYASPTKKQPISKWSYDMPGNQKGSGSSPYSSPQPSQGGSQSYSYSSPQPQPGYPSGGGSPYSYSPPQPYSYPQSQPWGYGMPGTQGGSYPQQPYSNYPSW